MNLKDKELKRQRTDFGSAIRSSDVNRVNALLAAGVIPGRNQFELAVRQALFGNAPLEDRLFIAEAIFKIIRDDADLLERAGRYVECTTITLGAYRNPIRTTLINMFGIVPGYAAKANHGVPTGVAVPAFS